MTVTERWWLVNDSRAGHKQLTTYWTLDSLKVDTPHFSGRNHASTFRAYLIERRLHLVEIDLPRAWHSGYFSPALPSPQTLALRAS